MLSYNHPIWWLKRNTPDTEYFHVEVGGEALIDRIAEVEAVYPGGMLHIEAAHVGPIGMLTAPYTGAEDVYAGYRGSPTWGSGCTARTSTTSTTVSRSSSR